MAERRMFAKSIIESDTFMDMPAEAQMLYIHLNMAADDDGFCDNPRSIMRQCGASNDSMKILMAKKYVLTFEKNDGFIVVVKHWRMNNYIRKDTYHETKYKEFMREMYYDENQSYSMNPGDGHVPCVRPSHPGPAPLPSQTRDEPVTDSSRTRDESLTQDRIGKSKDRVGKESIGKEREEKDNNSLCKIEEIGESEGEEQTAAPDVVLSGEAREKRIAELRYSAQRFVNLGFPPDSIYRLAQAEGIDPQEIAPTKKG